MARESVLNQRRGNRRIGTTPNILWLFVAFTCLMIFGILFTVIMIPRNESLKHVHSQLRGESLTLSQKLINWLPNDLERNSNEPDWEKKFWTPIDLEVSDDSIVILCQLNFKAYSHDPHKYSMFRDLVTVSDCTGRNRRRERISKLKREKSMDSSLINLEPTAFVFHESRVGSTLVANNLGADYYSLVFSESSPTANALLHCSQCSLEENINLFQDIVRLMGTTTFHKRLFFKFQSITTTKMKIALESFPDTPWVFIYRSPIQTMMSHLDPLKSSTGAPCLRSMRDPPPLVRQTISQLKDRDPPKDAWCAAHLDMLCSLALDNFEKYGYFASDSNRPRGLFINYDGLPGILGNVVLPYFGVEVSRKWFQRMKEESANYSKGKSVSREFVSDSSDKENRATDAIKKYSNLILMPSYMKMEDVSIGVFKKILGLSDSSSFSWSTLKGIPSEFNSMAKIILRGTKSFKTMDTADLENLSKHSKFEDLEYKPWLPFSNTHSSKPYENIDCPVIPSSDYPREYPILDITKNWGTDSTDIPNFHYDSLCHFDYQNDTELKAALAYRKAEVPFIVYNIPQVDDVVNKWNDIDYLHGKLGNKPFRTETSENNHFMYWRGGSNFVRNEDGSKWRPPTSIISTTFQEWIELAVKGQNQSLLDRTHQYFRVSSDTGNKWLFDELPFFKPVESLFMVNPNEQRGIHCRFGMRSVIAEAHFDGSRNAVVMLGGLRRWILTHPKYCSDMYMLKSNHPSSRHSDVDWSQPDLEKFPGFAKVRSNEVILQPGDYLYVPTFWIHYIVSLNINYQCNTRSGKSDEFDEDIKKCGF